MNDITLLTKEVVLGLIGHTPSENLFFLVQTKGKGVHYLRYYNHTTAIGTGECILIFDNGNYYEAHGINEYGKTWRLFSTVKK